MPVLRERLLVVAAFGLAALKDLVVVIQLCEVEPHFDAGASLPRMA